MKYWTSIKNITSQTASQIAETSKAIWLWLQGSPAELTYWIDGKQHVIMVRGFRQIKDNCIQFKNIETNKHVRVKTRLPIEYIIREE
mgnify:CR=1 FL=1